MLRQILLAITLVVPLIAYSPDIVHAACEPAPNGKYYANARENFSVDSIRGGYAWQRRAWMQTSTTSTINYSG